MPAKRKWSGAVFAVLSVLFAAALVSLLGAPAFAAGSAGDTVIEIDYIDTRDRLPPYEVRGIVVRNQVVATLSAANRVSEENEHIVQAPKQTFVTSAHNGATLGDNSARVVWRVLGPHRLRRIFAGQQFIMLTDIEISGERACSVQIKYLLQKGYADMITRRADNGELGHFSLPKVLSSQCSIR